MKITKIILVFLLCLSVTKTYFIFEPQGFQEFMERNFGSLNENENYRFNGEERINHCGNDENFGNGHHILPQNILRRVLSFSFLCWHRLSQNLHSFQWIVSKLNEILKLYHTRREPKEPDNAQALDQFSVDIIWDQNNLFCGPPEPQRVKRPGPELDLECVDHLKKNSKTERMNVISQFQCLDSLHTIYTTLPNPQNGHLEDKCNNYIQNCSTTSSKFNLLKNEMLEVVKGKNYNELQRLIRKEFKMDRIINLIKSMRKLKPIKATWTQQNGLFMVSSCRIAHQN